MSECKHKWERFNTFQFHCTKCKCTRLGTTIVNEQSRRILKLEAALRASTNELESWNLTQGDPDTAVVIVAAKDVLRTTGG